MYEPYGSIINVTDMCAPRKRSVAQTVAWARRTTVPYPTTDPERLYISIASIVPAATAVPITPATFGPMACIRR